MKTQPSSIILTLLLIAVTSACSTKESIDPNQYKGKKLYWGNGGGFSGATQYYLLTEKGRIYNKVEDVYIQRKKIKKQEAKQIFNTIESAGMLKLKYDEPGNIYNFLQPVIDKDSNSIVWAPSSSADSSIFAMLYLRLNRYLKE